MLQEVGWRDGVVATNCECKRIVLVRMRKAKIGGVDTSPILRVLFVAHILILDVELSVSQ
jgi:hypothetical protein